MGHGGGAFHGRGVQMCVGWPPPGAAQAIVADTDFVHFVGLRELNMRACNDVTDAAFVHEDAGHDRWDEDDVEEDEEEDEEWDWGEEEVEAA